MERTGATREDLAQVVVKNQRHGMLNPAAQFGGDLTVEQVLAGAGDRLAVHAADVLADLRRRGRGAPGQ